MTAYLYWYPEPGAGMVRTDLLYGLERLPYRSVPRGAGTLTLGGQMVPGRRGATTRIETTLTVTNADLHATLRTAHGPIGSGQVFGLSANHAKTWAAYSVADIQRGQTVIPYRAPRMSAIYSPSGTIATGDYVVIESGHPWHDYEEARVASVSATAITLATGCLRRHPGPALIRWREFHPHLALESGAEGQWLTDVAAGVTWRWEIRAVEAIQAASRSLAVSQLQSGPGVGGRNDAPDGKGTASPLIEAWQGDSAPGRRTPGVFQPSTKGGGGRGVL